ncbi:hypothetical protein [Fulvimarina sp. MAC3]|uniref:hypothetical protein n=1 Tax=Fulvimarina sp. MAC3 TaxID=3148887 RepID=UPI0031FC3324
MRFLGLFSFGLVATFAASAVAQSNPTIERAYEYYDQQMKSQDQKCLSAIQESISNDYDGLEKIAVRQNGQFETHDGYLFIYADARFESKLGNAEGAMVCVFQSDGETITDINILFDGEGLKGLRRPESLRAILPDRSIIYTRSLLD